MNPSCQGESSIRHRLPRYVGSSLEAPKSWTLARANARNADLAHDVKAVEQFGREFVREDLPRQGFKREGW
jgi:hypothetical protein